MTAKRDDLKQCFSQRFLICPVCNRKLGGSFSTGRSKKYPYYHCHDRCKIRTNAILLNNSYQKKLQELVLSNNIIELFRDVLEDQNIKTQKESSLYTKKLLERKIKEEKLILSQGRKFL